MALDKLILSFLVFSTFVVAGLFIMADMNESYDDVNFNTDKIQEINNTFQSLYNLTSNVEEDVFVSDPGITDVIEGLYKGAGNAVRALAAPLKIARAVIDLAARELKIPSIFVTIGITAFAVIIILSIVFLIFRFRA